MSLRKSLQIACPAAVLAVTAGGGAATIHVNAECGNDAWSGSSPVCAAPDGPKASVNAAIGATVDGDEIVLADGVYEGPGNRSMAVGGRSITIRSANGPDACVLDGDGLGRGLTVDDDASVTLEGLTMTGYLAEGFPSDVGGAVRIGDTDAVLRDCILTNNHAGIGGAIYKPIGPGTVVMERCRLTGNSCTYGSGGAFLGGDVLVLVDCVFAENDGGNGGPGGLGAVTGVSTFLNCVFAANTSGFVGGGVADGSGTLLMANCVFSRNIAASTGGGWESGNGAAVIANCTFSLNAGGGIGAATNSVLSNCILWANTPVQIAQPSLVVEHSDVQGGWPGSGNIDADPLFAQPGTDDVRLTAGSPCLDTGSDAAVPPDTLDLDGDGDLGEPLPFDLGGNPRVQGSAVEMGAWEGVYEPGLPSGIAGDLDEGEFVVLVPGAGAFNPLESSAVIVTNASGGDNALFTVTQFEQNLHPGAGGFAELGDILGITTTMDPGEYLASLFIPFDAAMLDGAGPAAVNLVVFDETAGSWAFATAGNIQASPGSTGPVGDRIAALAGGGWGLTQEIGDYGVYWDPQVEAGFVWANVDHAGDFAVGQPYCPADCLQTPDGLVGIADLLAMLALWGSDAGGGPCDVDFDGVVGIVDVGLLLATWGPCGPSGAAQPLPLREDLVAVRDAWGARGAGLAADANGDGFVDVGDWLAVMGR